MRLASTTSIATGRSKVLCSTRLPVTTMVSRLTASSAKAPPEKAAARMAASLAGRAIRAGSWVLMICLLFLLARSCLPRHGLFEADGCCASRLSPQSPTENHEPTRYDLRSASVVSKPRRELSIWRYDRKCSSPRRNMAARRVSRSCMTCADPPTPRPPYAARPVDELDVYLPVGR